MKTILDEKKKETRAFIVEDKVSNTIAHLRTYLNENSPLSDELILLESRHKRIEEEKPKRNFISRC